jgi:hypothetical protein
MSTVGSIIGNIAPSYVSTQAAAQAGAGSAAQMLLAAAPANAAQKAAAQTGGTAQTAAAAVKTVAATAGTSGIVPLSSGVLETLINNQAQPVQAAAAPDAGLATVPAGTDPAKVFLNYMKETPAQRIQDTWLANHHLTQQQLAAMPAAERQAIEKRMQAEIKEKITQDSANKLKSKVLLVA